MVSKAVSKILLVQEAEKREGPEDYNFKGLGFEECVVLDTIIKPENFTEILKFIRIKADPSTAMFFDFINRVDKLNTQATLEDCLNYACAVMQVSDFLLYKRPDIDIKNKATRAIVNAVLQSITGLEDSLIEQIKTPDDAEAAAFIGAYVNAKHGEYEFKKDLRTTAELLAEKNAVTNVPDILLKFGDRKTALKYFEKNKAKLSAEDYHAKSRLHSLEKDVEGEVFSLLEASKLDVGYVNELSKIIASRELNSSLLDKLDSALDKVSDSELLYRLEPQDTKRAIRLLERAVGLKEDERYYMRLGELHINASHSINAGLSFANAVRLNPSLLSDIMEEVQSAKIQAEFAAGLAQLGRNISVVVSACSEQEQVRIFASHLNNNIIFNYFVNDTKNFKDILPQVEKKLSVQLSADQYETVADKALLLGLDDIADRFYDKEIVLSPNVKAYIAKHDINLKRNNALEAFKCLAKAIKVCPEIPLGSIEVQKGMRYKKLLEQAKSEIIASGGQALFVETMLNNLPDKIFKNDNLQLCVSLANQLKSEREIIKCYEKFNSIAEVPDLKSLPWAKEFLTVAHYLEKGKNLDGALRFLDEMLRRDDCAHDARIKKENILLEQGKRFESLELILEGLAVLKPGDENTEHRAKYTKIICERLEHGTYVKRELRFLAGAIIPFFDNSATQIIESAKVHSDSGDRDYAEFISKVYDAIIPICLPVVRAAYYADKARVELQFDAKKSLDSFVEAIKEDYTYFDGLLEIGYDLQAIREVLPSIIKNMPVHVDANASKEFAALGNRFKEEAKKAVENSIQWQNSVKSAIMCFEEAKAHWPTSEAYDALGGLYNLMRDDNNALNAFINAAELSKNYSTLEQFCDGLFGEKNYDGALKGYDFILSLRSSERVLINAGRCKVELNDNARAIEYFDNVLQIAEVELVIRSEAFFWKSVALENSGNASGALNAINSVFSAGANGGNEFYSRKLDLELKLGKIEDATTTFNSVPAGELKRQYQSRVAVMLAQRGYEKLSAGDSGAVLDLANKSLEIENNWLAHYVKGLHKEKSLAFVSAVHSYKQAIMLAAQSMEKIISNSLERCVLKAYEYDNISVISAGHVAGKTDWLAELYTDKHGKSATRLSAIDTVLNFSFS